MDDGNSVAKFRGVNIGPIRAVWKKILRAMNAQLALH